MNDLDAIKEAAKLGGADEFIEKLPSGYDTIMGEEPESVSAGSPPEGSALDVMLKEKKEAPQAFSGGQTQRMALSRTFMRSMGDGVKLLAYDEPSAALDPKAEFGKDTLSDNPVPFGDCPPFSALRETSKSQGRQDDAVYHPSVWISYQVCRSDHLYGEGQSCGERVS